LNELDRSNEIQVEQYTFEHIRSKVECAVNDFRENDLDLLELSADERAATHQIACYLKKYFPGWNVDCEYNRKNAEPKRLQGELVRPDIIIHRRNLNTNLLCIEAKKFGNQLIDDRKKLCGFTDPKGEYKYRIGLFLILSLTSPYNIRYEWFCDGNAI